jgi:hypothetical protein
VGLSQSQDLQILSVSGFDESIAKKIKRIRHAIRLQSLHSHRSLSENVNEALLLELREDEEDIASFEQHANEPLITNEELLKDLKAHEKI